MRRYLKFLLWLLFCLTFTFELVKIIFELGPAAGHQKLGWANALFWSSLFLVEMVMAGMVIYYLVHFPARRKRLIVLAACHFSVILLLPTLLNDWSWTCVLYPWPHSLQAFDPATPIPAFALSLIVGFVLAPFLSYTWGMKGFCGYICPHGAFFSETYGRIFPSRPDTLKWVASYVPPFYFAFMTIALAGIIVIPASIGPLRSVQKYVYFITAEFFYFVIAIPLIGGRSYCRLICPMGYLMKQIVRLKKRKEGRLLNSSP
jgi:polyferredoxin